jgi:hypothetical protein
MENRQQKSCTLSSVRKLSTPDKRDLKRIVREIREIRKGALLRGLTIRQLIDEGRRY